MRYTLIVSAFAALALAAPRPQDIDFEQVDAAPEADPVSPPIDVSVDVVAVQPVAAATALAAASVTEVATAEKRDFLEVAGLLEKRNAECAAETPGTGPQVSR